MGDFNALHEAWFSQTTSLARARRQDEINESVDASSFVVLNRDELTRLPARGPPSSPDVALISAHLTLDTVWSVFTALNSDHRPIISLRGDTPPKSLLRSFSNFRKADWEGYREESKQAFLMLATHMRKNSHSSAG